MSVFILYLIVTYLIGLGQAIVFDENKERTRDKILLFIFSPLIVPIAIGIKTVDRKEE